jgi:ribosomal protein S18 acetylase RimI-like enzyme
MPKYQLKLASKKIDFAHIVFIQKNDGYEHAYYLTEDRIERLVEAGEKFYILYRDDEFVGMASVDAEIRIQLHFFSVLKEYQSTGVDTQMLELLLEKVKEQTVQHHAIHCYTEADAPLLSFLKKHGFEEVGFYKNRYQNGKDAVIVEKKL